MSGSPNRDEALRSLKELQAELAALPKEQAVARIRHYLDEGKDRSTGLSFEIGSGGSLLEWPTLRTFLLDALQGIDPAAAATAGRGILARATSADEWAIALRNVALGEPLGECASFLRAKTEELIGNPLWQADPSIGYLNAFDVLVHVEAVESQPLLSGLIQQKDRGDLAHAGFLTLDRLVQRRPAELLETLAADAALSRSRPEMSAQQFARADVRDPAQRSVLKNWLLDPARTPNELRSFAGVYPNNNRFVSNNLLTTESTQSGAALADHDRVALATVSAWAEDPGFRPVRGYLDLMISRLEGFVSKPSSLPPPEK